MTIGFRGKRGFAKVPREQGPRLNEQIRVPEVRLIDELGNQVGVVSTQEALRKAQDVGLDLVEVSPNGKPPVCKIIDYGKFKYEKKKKESVARKKQVVIEVKEIQLRPKTDVHDFEHKVKNAEKFLENGDKVKVSIIFRGREVAYHEIGYGLMAKVSKALEEFSQIEQRPTLEGRRMTMILAPLKKKKPKPQAQAAKAPPSKEKKQEKEAEAT